MGISITHDVGYCRYSVFNNMRRVLCDVAGYGNLDHYQGYGGVKLFPENESLSILICKRDDDDEVSPEDCGLLAERLIEISDRIPKDDKPWLLQPFIEGLKDAHKMNETLFWC